MQNNNNHKNYRSYTTFLPKITFQRYSCKNIFVRVLNMPQVNADVKPFPGKIVEFFEKIISKTHKNGWFYFSF